METLQCPPLKFIGSKQLGSTFDAVGKIEWWARNATGTVMLVIGIYLSVRYIFLA